MKAVLISTRPNWCEKICRKIGEENGIPVYLKPVEVRKSAPKEVPFKAYLYCTNGRFDITDIEDLTSESVRVVSEGRGKVIGEFVCDQTRDYIPFGLRGYELPSEWLENMCLSKEQLDNYGGLKTLHGWHFSDLKIYDTPRELSEFKKPEEWCHMVVKRDGHLTFFDGYVSGMPIKRPPQSWQYVEEVEVIEKAGQWQGYVTDKLPIIKCYDAVFHKLVKGENPDER